MNPWVAPIKIMDAELWMLEKWAAGAGRREQPRVTAIRLCLSREIVNLPLDEPMDLHRRGQCGAALLQETEQISMELH
jgi:hypothetical protein